MLLELVWSTFKTHDKITVTLLLKDAANIS